MRRKSSRFCVLKSGSHVLGKPGRNDNRLVFPRDIEFLAANSPFIERDVISLAFFVG